MQAHPEAKDYDQKSIAGFSRKDYLAFLEGIFTFLREHTKKTTRLAFINADWRNFQNKPDGWVEIKNDQPRMERL